MKKTILCLIILLSLLMICSCKKDNTDSNTNISSQELSVYIYASSKNKETIYLNETEIEDIKNAFHILNREFFVKWNIYNDLTEKEFGDIVNKAKDASVVIAGSDIDNKDVFNISLSNKENTKKALLDSSWNELSNTYIGITSTCDDEHIDTAIALRNMLISKKIDGLDKQKILLIGNSFTYYNDLNIMMEEVCKNQGIDVLVDKITKSGAHLKEFLDDSSIEYTNLENYLSNYKYDYIFIQEYGTGPLIRYNEFDSSIDDMLKFIRLYNKEANIYLYETWARATGNSFYEDHPEYNYKTTQKGVFDAYNTIAEKYNLTPSYAGVGMYIGYTGDFGIKLYQDDLYHPTPAGSYLTALIHTSTIFGINPKDVTYVPDFMVSRGGKYRTMPTEEECITLREIAYSVIFENDIESISIMLGE